MLNFVVDLPVRVDDLLPSAEPGATSSAAWCSPWSSSRSSTAPPPPATRQGDSSHERYKRRQLKRVLRRLSRGLVVPKRPPRKRRGRDEGADEGEPARPGSGRDDGTCQVCGEVGRVIAVPGAPPPNELCARCAIEYGETAEEDEDDEA